MGNTFGIPLKQKTKCSLELNYMYTSCAEIN